MKIGFIGAGKVGSAMGLFFKKHHLQISGYYSRSQASAQTAADQTGSQLFLSIPELLKASSHLFITTGDDQIAAVAEKLAQTGELTAEHTLIHTSGALSTDLFAPAISSGCGLCSLHPIMSFSDISAAARDLAKTFFTLEGNEKGLKAVREILNATGSTAFMIRKEDKVLYHAAACILSNYLVTLMHEGFELLASIGLEKQAAQSAFLPLIYSTLNNIENAGTVSALTGPLVRGDANTIDAHVTALRRETPELLPFYQRLGQSTLAMIKDKRLDAGSAENLKTILNNA